MPTAYKVVGRAHRRSSRVPQTVTLPGGGTTVVEQPGPLVTVPVNAIIADITPEELAAFPDRFKMATAEEVAAWDKQKQDAKDAFLPTQPVAIDPKRLELEQQIQHLQQQLAAMPNPDPSKALLERAPVDPVTSERAALEREALRQAVAEHHEQVQAAATAATTTPTTPSAEGGETRTPGRRAQGGAARTEEPS